MERHRRLRVIWLFCFEQYFKAKYDDERNNMITGFTEVKTFVIDFCADFREFGNGFDFAFLANKYFANIFLLAISKIFLKHFEIIFNPKNSKIISKIIENLSFVFAFNPKITINFYKNALNQNRSVLSFFLIINGGDENVATKTLNGEYFLQVHKNSANLLNYKYINTVNSVEIFNVMMSALSSGYVFSNSSNATSEIGYSFFAKLLRNDNFKEKSSKKFNLY